MKRTIITVVLIIAAALGGLLTGLFLASRGGAKPSHSTRAVNTAGATTSSSGVAAASRPKRKILYYWDPMVGPASISPKPGISSMGMALIPVYAPASGAAVPGEVRVDPAMVQDMGIQTAKVTLGSLERLVRTVGYLRTPAPQRYSITIRAGGWIGKLYATTNGAAIHKGQKLFTLYSPRIVAAEGELIAAQRALLTARTAGNAGVIQDARELRQSVEMRLAYLGVSRSQIKTVERSLHALTFVCFYSPATGALADIKVRQKSRINAGTSVMRVENLKALWLDTYIYENQIPWVRMGQRVTAKIAAFPGRAFMGKIIFIDQFESLYNHTVAIRIVLDNASHDLRPGMYALADIHTQPVDHAILTPRQAIINTGTGELAFVEVSRGHFDPVTVKTGLSGEHGLVQVISGLEPGQNVLTSGQFAIDVESQLNEIKARFMPKLQAAKPVKEDHKPHAHVPTATSRPAAAKPAAAMPGSLSEQPVGCDGPETPRMRGGGLTATLAKMSRRDPTTKQAGRFRPTLRAACFSAPIGGAASSAYRLGQVRPRRRFLTGAKNHDVAAHRLLGQTPGE